MSSPCFPCHVAQTTRHIRSKILREPNASSKLSSPESNSSSEMSTSRWLCVHFIHHASAAAVCVRGPRYILHNLKIPPGVDSTRGSGEKIKDGNIVDFPSEGRFQEKKKKTPRGKTPVATVFPDQCQAEGLLGVQTN